MRLICPPHPILINRVCYSNTLIFSDKYLAAEHIKKRERLIFISLLYLQESYDRRSKKKSGIEKMKHIEFDWQTTCGLQICAQGWEPEQGAKAVVCLVHGLGEHSGRYSSLANYLNENGYALLAFDQRGHGSSQGQKGHTPSYEALMDDVDRLLAEADSRFPDIPRFLYGHSMGGNLVINYALRRKPELVGVIASGPWLRLAFEPSKFNVALARLMNRLHPSLSQPNGLDINAISRDPEVVRAYEEDPLVHDRISARLFVEMYQAGLWALDHGSEFRLPLLLMHGSADGLTSAGASEEFAGKVGEKCTFKRWEGFYHEVHNEPEHEEVFEFIRTWLDEHASA